MSTTHRRWKLRNLDVPQKLLVLATIATIGGGYLAALANLFAQTSVSDGRPGIKLEEFPRVLKAEGVAALANKVQDALGMQDVVRRYSGSGGKTSMEGALDGSMKGKIAEKLVKDEGDTAENRARAEDLRQMLAEWSKLADPQRKKAYEEGTPINDKGLAILGDPPKGLKDADLSPVVKDALDNYCVRCHKAGGVDKQAESLPLDSYDAVNKYCGVDTGISIKSLALTSHVHLLGFAVLFTLSGFLFSMTETPWLVRLVFVPWTLSIQLIEVACWWLAKVDVFYAKMIFYLGPLVGIGLLIQIAGVFLDLLIRRPEKTA
jgi:hypothetical protein